MLHPQTDPLGTCNPEPAPALFPVCRVGMFTASSTGLDTQQDSVRVRDPPYSLRRDFPPLLKLGIRGGTKRANPLGSGGEPGSGSAGCRAHRTLPSVDCIPGPKASALSVSVTLVMGLCSSEWISVLSASGLGCVTLLAHGMGQQ